MHIIEKVKVDGAGRLSLTKVFAKVPREVIVSFEPKSKKLVFTEIPENDNVAATRKIDSKNRVSLPKWLLEELGEEYYICSESVGEHYVLPSKFLFIG